MVLGVDIGATGAIALLDESGGLLDVVDMPTLGSGPEGRRETCPARLASLVRGLGADIAYVEVVGARPKSAARATFTFGRARGVVEGVLAACGVPTSWLTADQWHRVVGLPTGSTKDQSIAEALRRWPGCTALLTRHDHAEAALIGLAGLLRARAREAA